MSHPNVEQFKQMLREKPLDDVVRKYVFGGEPYAFREMPHAYTLLRNHLSKQIGTLAENITLVGSGKAGFSLKPDTFPRQFSDESDLDIVVVDEELFNRLWMALLKWNYPRRYSWLPPDDWEWVKKRQKDIYWGWFLQADVRGHYRRVTPRRPLQVWQEFSTRWFNAFKSLSLHKELARWQVKGRLYRTWDHALLYHTDGLRQIRESL